MSRRVSVFGSVLVAALVAGSFFAGRAWSEDPPAGAPPMSEKMKEKMAEWAKMMAVGPSHEQLKVFEGDWVGKGSWAEEGMPPMEYTETVVGKMIFGGRFLRIEAEMTSAGMAMNSLGYLGFDNAKQKFVHTMLGDFTTAIGTSEGTYDAATKTYTLSGIETLGAGKERKYRMVHKVISKDEWKFEMYFTGADGAEVKAGEGTYKRK